MADVGVRKLADSQLQTFAHRDYVTDELFDGIADAIEREFGQGSFSFLDVGGGGGLFADRLLARFPEARATVLDNSELLLSQNAANDRKDLILASATEMAESVGERRFDLVFFNFSLHHFIGASYAQTRQIQRDALGQGAALVAPGGRIVVTENLYDGMIVDNMPGFLVYTLTSNKAFASLIGRLGANTAGLGVCFLSASEWRKEFARLGWRDSAFAATVWQEKRMWRVLGFRLLGIASISTGFFWLVPGGGDGSLAGEKKADAVSEKMRDHI
jgi:hypothetical protein